MQGSKHLNLVFNPTWKQSVLISAKKAPSLVSSQQAVNCQLSKLLLFPFMASLRGVAFVETGSERLSWQVRELGTCVFFLFFSSLFWNKCAHLPVGHRVLQDSCNRINCLNVQCFYLSHLQNARWNRTYCSQASSLQLCMCPI